MIRVLPETVQNKIAAGEVVERPASVVKELVENSIDAGSDRVAVDLEEGGHRLIRVSDNGCGMDEEDLLASVERHATSKIRDVEDIFSITTMGFRGEALPSIASVSRLSIVTGREGAPDARQLIIEGGKIIRLSPAPPRRGTVVEVADIFYNTPARRKFLRSPSSENSQAAELLTRIALTRPDLDVRLQINGRITFSTHPKTSLIDRIADIFGQETAAKMLPLDREITEGIRVGGFVARPPESRANSRGVYVLVNRRWIRHAGLARVVADAFQGALPPRRYPFAVVELAIDPSRVDVNVHPTKEEIRFDNEGLVVAGVRKAVDAALGRFSALPTVATMGGGLAGTRLVPSRPIESTPSSGEKAERAASSAGTPSGGGQMDMRLPASLARPKGTDFSRADFSAIRDRLRQVGAPPGRIAEPPPAAAAPESPAAPALPVGSAATHRILGQAGGKYILIDGPEGLLLVDPHALHERWNYDRLLESRGGKHIARRLLVPLEIALSPAEAALAPEALPLLAEYGFDLELPEPGLLRIKATPDIVPAAKAEELLRLALADLDQAGTRLNSFRDNLLASLACRSSVLLGKTLPEEEILSLLDKFFHAGQMPTCPHGRPTAISIAWEELARRFGR